MNTHLVDRNEIFDLAFRFITETSENIFLTGKAGTGKTTFLKYLKDNCTKNIIIAAPTGVAAINAGGVTLHSLFQLPFHPFLPTKISKEELLSKIRYNKQRQQLLRKMELLVIDEISMVRCDVMDAIDTILKSIRRNFDVPFGGIQLLCIGDLHQLPPVAQHHEWNILKEYYSSPFFFDSLAIKEQMPLLIELNKIYRQKEDSFVRLLNKVRNNTMDADDYEELHLRYNPLFNPLPNEKYITLTSHNKQANEINQQKIENLFTAPYYYNAIIENDFAEHIYPAEASLYLKVGAQVMFLKNDIVSKRYFNGKIGVITYLEKEKILVDCDGVEIEVGKETWENTKYTLNPTDGKLEQETLGTFTQYPLRLAWAITIHKSQGLTFEKAMIDAGSSFSSGQVYVALSRCTSLEGIILLSKLSNATLFSNPNVIKGQHSLTHKGSLQDRFNGARQVFTQQLLFDIFSFAAIENSITVLHYNINQQHLKLKSNVIDWIENLKLNILNDKNIGLKFIEVLSTMLKHEPTIEKNVAVQNRIIDAANHFEPKFLSYQNNLQNHPLLTEHKETANIINEILQQLALDFFTTIYYLQYCKQPFSVTTFLQYKLKFAQPKFNISCYAANKKETVVDSANSTLYNTLKLWRDMTVEQEKVPIYMVANQATLNEMATYLPRTKKDLLQITGFGKAKVDKYGDDILNAINDYCDKNNLESNIINLPKKKSTEKKVDKKDTLLETDTKTISFNLFTNGKSISDIAKERNLSETTIETHLCYFIETGQIDLNKLVTPSQQKIILNAINVLGSSKPYKPIYEFTEGKCSYAEIKMVTASLS